MAAILDGTDLHLVGAIGVGLMEDFFTHAEVLMAIAQAGHSANLRIHLNSPGGYIDQAEGIANAIKARSGKTVVVVTGVAWSAATIVACAADEIVMCQGALWMVHEPQVNMSFADSSAIASLARYQHLATNVYAAAYVEKTGKTDAEVRSWMKATTYFDADEAVAAGFADRKSAEVINLVEVAPPFPYADEKVFAHAPARLVALAIEKNWSLPEASKRAAGSAAETRPKEEKSMTEKERADQLAAENTQLKADLDAAKAAKEVGVTEASTTAAEIVEVCAAAGVPTMASALIREGLTVEAAKGRADNAKQVRTAVATAKKSTPSIPDGLADTFISAGLTMDQVRSKLFETMTAAQSGEISGAHQATAKTDDAAAVAASIVATIRPNRAQRSA